MPPAGYLWSNALSAGLSVRNYGLFVDNAAQAPRVKDPSLQGVTNFPESGLFLEEPTISPDGKFLVYSRSRGGSSLWLLTLGTPRAPSSDRAP